MTNLASKTNVRTSPNTSIIPAECLSALWNILLAIILFIVLSPVMLIVYAALFFSKIKKPIFKQVRVGKNGNHFIIYKFQTMFDEIAKTDPFICTCYSDPRITPIGRFLRRKKLDELPQLINIIKGDMNFVGPRPEVPYFHHENIMSVPNWVDRLAVKPGVTGPAQIHPRVSHNPHEKIILDLDYIQNQSFLGDLKIIWLTAFGWLVRKSL